MLRRRITPLLFLVLGLALWIGRAAAAPALPEDASAIEHALNRLTFGPTADDVAHVRRIRLAAWFEQQLHPANIDDSAMDARLAQYTTLSLDASDIARDYFRPARQARRTLKRDQVSSDPKMDPSGTNQQAQRDPAMLAVIQRQRGLLEDLSSAKLLRATYSNRQLEEVLVDFWFNHFNVFARKGRTAIYLTEYERDTIRPHVLGTFRELLGATAKSPAMLFYLDNWMSADPDAPAQMNPRRALFAPQAKRPRGLNENYGRELLELHTLGVDGGYSQHDVIEVARAFTGWTIDPREQRFRFAPALHDRGAKVVLGHTINAGGGIEDGERVLDILAEHPATARHIATQLVERFVSDTPPQSLVDRAAARFHDTHGDLREVMRTIVTAPEFFAPEYRRAKIKTPVEFIASALRTTGAHIDNPRPLLRALQQLGMPLYLCQPPTGYSDKADAWVSSGALVTRMNLALEMAMRSRVFTIARADDVTSLRTRLIHDALGDNVSASTRATIEKATTPEQTIALILGSPEFQRQ